MCGWNRTTFVLLVPLLVALIAAVLPSRGTHPGTSGNGSGTFSVVGRDLSSPLLTSAIALQTLNALPDAVARYAGYDQLDALSFNGSRTVLARVTRFSGDIFCVLGGEWLIDARREIHEDRILISEHYWTNNLGADPNITGKPLNVGHQTYHIAGVVRVTGGLLSDTDFWLPICSRRSNGSTTSLRLIGKLDPGRDWKAGERQLARIMKTERMREQVMELDSVRLLPVDRKLFFYASNSELDEWMVALRLRRAGV